MLFVQLEVGGDNIGTLQNFTAGDFTEKPNMRGRELVSVSVISQLSVQAWTAQLLSWNLFSSSPHLTPQTAENEDLYSESHLCFGGAGNTSSLDIESQVKLSSHF